MVVSEMLRKQEDDRLNELNVMTLHRTKGAMIMHPRSNSFLRGEPKQNKQSAKQGSEWHRSTIVVRRLSAIIPHHFSDEENLK